MGPVPPVSPGLRDAALSGEGEVYHYHIDVTIDHVMPMYREGFEVENKLAVLMLKCSDSLSANRNLSHTAFKLSFTHYPFFKNLFT